MNGYQERQHRGWGGDAGIRWHPGRLFGLWGWGLGPLPQDGGSAWAESREMGWGQPSPSWVLPSSLCSTNKAFVLHLECCILA